MFFLNLFLLVLSWFFVLASERIIPPLQSELSMSDQWITYLVFRPFHVFLAAILFILAYMIIRRVLKQNVKMVFRYGKIGSRLEGILTMLLALLLVLVFISKHLFPSLGILFLFAIYDGTIWLFGLRRQKRLRAVFRQTT